MECPDLNKIGGIEMSVFDVEELDLFCLKMEEEDPEDREEDEEEPEDQPEEEGMDENWD